MFGSRPRSASQDSRYSNKPILQKKWKERSGNRSIVEENPSGKINVHIDETKSVRSKSSSKKRSNSVILEPSKGFDLDDIFRNTSKKLTKANFSHHHPELCVCEECLCGRHFCKFHNVAPNLSKASIYQKDYPKKKPVENKVYIAQEYEKMDGPHLNMNSTQGKDFTPKKNDDLTRPKPEDLLKTGGPCPNLSSYKTDFPGHHGENQYVKPTDKHTRGSFPLRARSTYNGCFKGQPKKKDDWEGIQDNLKLGASWLGDTSYKNSFKAPNPQAYPKHVKVEEKLEINPNYCRQYETTHRNDFVNKGKTVCPAKVLLETKGQGIFRNSKNNFAENADYKAMQPQFQAISTGKFSYVQG